jgi:hypothetical protein
MSMMRRLWIILALAACAPPIAFCQNCSWEGRDIPIDRNAAKRLQNHVNQGHEPWRLDAQAVAGEQLLVLEPDSDKTHSVYGYDLQVLEEDGKHVVFQFRGGNRGDIAYRITVRRLDWLLPVAKKWEWMIWLATRLESSSCVNTSRP